MQMDWWWCQEQCCGQFSLSSCTYHNHEGLCSGCSAEVRVFLMCGDIKINGRNTQPSILQYMATINEGRD